MSSEFNAKKVSVLIPVYNSQAYISRCLDSIIAQTYSEWEIVCIDDGSSDSSPLILDEYRSRYPDKIIVEHRSNEGVAAARNRAIALATGEYLVFADNDDWLDVDYIDTLLTAALNSGADVVCSGYKRPNNNGDILFSTSPKPDTEWGPYVVEAAWAKIYRTDYVRKNHLCFLDTNIGEDLYFSIPAIELTNNIQIISYCGYNWFFNESSVSNTKHRSSDSLLFEETLNKIILMLKARGLFQRPILIHYIIRLIVWFLFYTGKSDGVQKARINYDHYVNWLDSEVVGWRHESFASCQHPTGDAIKNRLAVWLFVRHPRLFGCILHVYVGYF